SAQSDVTRPLCPADSHSMSVKCVAKIQFQEHARMQWIAPSEKDIATDTLEKRLWAAADQLRANSGLTSAQYSQPVLGLIFLRFAEVRFAVQRAKLEKVSASSRRGSRVDDPTAYHADGVLYLTPNSRFAYLRDLNCSTSGQSFPKRGLVHWTNPSSTG